VRNKKYSFGTNFEVKFAKESVDNYRTVHSDTVYAWWAGWGRTVFFSHTYRSQLISWWKDGVDKNSVLIAHMPEPN
jgi:hypothetical protein